MADERNLVDEEDAVKGKTAQKIEEKKRKKREKKEKKEKKQIR